MMKQGTRVADKATGRTGVIESGVPLVVANRKYVTVRWDDGRSVDNVGVWKLRKV